MFLTVNLTEVFLDSDSNVNWAMVKGLLEGRKRAFKLKEVAYIQVPRWPELSMKKLLPMAMSDPEVRIYHRDDALETGCISREFLCCILNTVYAEYFPFIIK